MSDTNSLYSRRELFLQKIADNSVQAPEPITREEMFLAKLAGMDVVTPTPSSRAEMYLAAAAGEDVVLPDPISRDELFLAKMAGMDVITPEPESSKEMMMNDAAENTGGGSDTPVVEYVVTFMSEDGQTKLGEQTVKHGRTCPDIVSKGLIDKPTKASTDYYDYPFAGWATTSGGTAYDKALRGITADKTVYAAFDAQLKDGLYMTLVLVERAIAGYCENNRVDTIRPGAFHSCDNLTKVNFAAVASIGEGAFADCANLKTVVLPASQVVSLESADAFERTPIADGTGFVYVPADLIAAYKTGNWMAYANQLRAIEDYPDICA